uniref:LIM zinc-binding domain-containing protein n=1 Tax=Haemonchus placei TaxID=6290 RepID=A0A0N4WDS9_HAEPC
LRSAADVVAELESLARTCNRCHQPFREDELYVALEGTSWHQGCFRCAQCLLSLDLNEDFFEVDGRFYCKHDFEVLYSPICTKCNSFIVGKVMKSANYCFHPDCFRCASCDGSLDDGAWCVDGRVALTGEARQLLKNWYCPRCFDKRCETCASCHKPIDKERERSTMALGKKFHVEHFRCAKCGVAFMGRHHFEHNGKAYCEEDIVQVDGKLYSFFFLRYALYRSGGGTIKNRPCCGQPIGGGSHTHCTYISHWLFTP